MSGLLLFALLVLLGVFLILYTFRDLSALDVA